MKVALGSFSGSLLPSSSFFCISFRSQLLLLLFSSFLPSFRSFSSSRSSAGDLETMNFSLSYLLAHSISFSSRWMTAESICQFILFNSITLKEKGGSSEEKTRNPSEKLPKNLLEQKMYKLREAKLTD